MNKETNIIETKQLKSKSNWQLKATEYTIFEDKFQMPEYTTFQRVKGLVSYSKFQFKKIDFLIKPIVLAAIHNPFFPSVYITASTACA